MVGKGQSTCDKYKIRLKGDTMSVEYTITITNPSAGAPSNGFIDVKRLEQYGSLVGVTFDHAQAKKRGNFRHQYILESLASMANPLIVSQAATGGSGTTEPTAYTFVIKFDSSATPRVIRDENEYTGAQAVKQLVAEALMVSETRVCDVYHPQSINRIGPLEIGYLTNNITSAKALVTVTTA